ncbi:protein MAINTENANCE OF MERISTEMS-like [Rhododendron vialii]|uniref:protein MAINTENANCE OF MERISTEMS-like n=1 Tax=Rhododendron vialii TaxID=182163 RepID=UPI00265D6755|nr:protein MAINTENANCE OF MERISTEMS-like [Rhododendron vialii]
MAVGDRLWGQEVDLAAEELMSRPKNRCLDREKAKSQKIDLSSVQELVHATGFKAFDLGLNLPKIDWSLMTSLVKRWWDTTNTFHFPSAGEVTITPGDFSLLTSLRVGGAPLRIDPQLWRREGALEWFLGKMPPLHSRGRLDVSWLSKTFMKADILTQVSVEQLTRAFLLYLLGQTLFANKDSSVHTQFLAPLRYLGAVWEFDWGSSVLASLYGNLGACSRDKSFICAGHYRVLDQLWAFEHLLQFSINTRHEDANCVPRYERWWAGQQKPRSPILSFPEWRRVLDRLTVNQVQFDPWGGISEDVPLARSRVLDRTCSLLEGPFCRAWYLVDQVASQWRPCAKAF